VLYRFVKVHGKQRKENHNPKSVIRIDSCRPDDRLGLVLMFATEGIVASELFEGGGIGFEVLGVNARVVETEWTFGNGSVLIVGG